jgi:hypothetical protein
MFSRQLTTTVRVARRSFATSSAVRADKPLSESVKETVQEVANKFKNTGSIGSKFEKGGDVAEAAEEVGGPFSSKGAVGKQFVSDSFILHRLRLHHTSLCSLFDHLY